MNNKKAKLLRKAAKEMVKEPDNSLVQLGNRMLMYKVGSVNSIYTRLKRAYSRHQFKISK